MDAREMIGARVNSAAAGQPSAMEADVGTSRMEEWIDRIRGAQAHAHGIAELLSCHADRLFGPEREGGILGAEAPVPACAAEGLEVALCCLSDALDRLEREAARNCRLA